MKATTPHSAADGTPAAARRARRVRAEERVYRVLGICAAGVVLGLVGAALGTWALDALRWGCPVPAGEVAPVCDGDWRRATFVGLGSVGAAAGLVLAIGVVTGVERRRGVVARTCA